MWSREPFEVFAIFESMNEPAVDGLPTVAMEYADFGGLCDKLMIVHPGKFCSAHFHWRKTEYYEVVLGEMDVFYAPEIIDFPELGVVAADVIQRTPMPQGDAWPDDIVLPKGREQYWELLTSYRRLKKGDPKFLMPRKHLHGFGCPARCPYPAGRPRELRLQPRAHRGRQGRPAARVAAHPRQPLPGRAPTRDG